MELEHEKEPEQNEFVDHLKMMQKHGLGKDLESQTTQLATARETILGTNSVGETLSSSAVNREERHS